MKLKRETTVVRVLELFCGIGGCAAALSGMPSSIVAMDINRVALDVYRHNFQHEIRVGELSSVSTVSLAAFDADLWWMSPPCQPFTAQGNRRDDIDRRTQAFRHLLGSFQQLRPRYLALENVPPFRCSSSRNGMIQVLNGAKYQWREQILCGTDLGLINRRRRYYLVAARDHDLELTGPSERSEPGANTPLCVLLDEDSDRIAFDADRILPHYRPHLHLVRAADPHATTHCFTSAYGKSPLRSGSYLALPTPTGAERIRHFSPREILRFLGFPAEFSIPEQITTRQAWSLVGNSLAVPAVRHVLRAIPAFRDG